MRTRMTLEDQLVQEAFRVNCSTSVMACCCHPELSPEQFQYLLDQHSDYGFLNCSDPDVKATPLLMLACGGTSSSSVQVSYAKILLENSKYGVDVNARSEASKSEPIHGAAECGSTEIVKLLLRHGANCLSRNLNGKPTTPLDIAVQNNFTEIVAHLINAAVEQGKTGIFHTTNSHHQSGVMMAMARQRIEVIGTMAKTPGFDLRFGFHVFWAYDPNDLQKIDYIGPKPSFRPPHWALYKTVYSFVTLTCCNCRDTRVNLGCSRCRMAWYCGVSCQRADWKLHKLCCRRLNVGMGLIHKGGYKLSKPINSKQQAGFIESFEEKVNSTLPWPERWSQEEHPIWEYQRGVYGKQVWERYPPLIEDAIESMMQAGSPRYMYRPNQPDCAGFYEMAPFSKFPNPEVSTRYVYFACMMEFDVYTGAARAVRRNGSIDNPQL